MNSQPDGNIPEITLGDRLRLARRHAKMGQQELADVLGVSVTTYGNWESVGNQPRNMTEVVGAIAEATSVNFVWLMTGFRTENR